MPLPVYPRLQLDLNDKVTCYKLVQYDEKLASFLKLCQSSGHVTLNLGPPRRRHPKFSIKANANLKPQYPFHGEDGEKGNNALESAAESMSSKVQIDSPNANVQVVEFRNAEFQLKSRNADPQEVDGREWMRRMRISKANKGKSPWNRGIKHSPETREHISARTKLAMQNPKVKMKLTSLGHAQSQETKERISHGVRLGWQRRHLRLKIQKFCISEWQDLIAETARRGFFDDEELQWNSYEILDQQLHKKWLNSKELKKQNRKSTYGKRAPKSPEQRKKIAEAIAAKWADPEYRSKVMSGLAKFYGTREKLTKTNEGGHD